MRQLVAELFRASPLLFLPLFALALFLLTFLVASIRAWRGGARGRAEEALLPFDPKEDGHV
jgi:hypothetical protein